MFCCETIIGPRGRKYRANLNEDEIDEDTILKIESDIGSLADIKEKTLLKKRLHKKYIEILQDERDTYFDILKKTEAINASSANSEDETRGNIFYLLSSIFYLLSSGFSNS